MQEKHKLIFKNLYPWLTSHQISMALRDAKLTHADWLEFLDVMLSDPKESINTTKRGKANGTH